ncbi:MAG: thiolase family protein [Oligoflexales bacterium]
MITNYLPSSFEGNGRPVFVDGVRSAFVKSYGVFEDCDALELYSRVTDGLLRKIGLDYEIIDEMIAGAVVPQTKNPNIARDTILNLGLPSKINGYTINRTCASSLQCIINASQTIRSGHPSFILAGGVECLSDVPIVYSRAARKFLVKLSKAKSATSKLNIIKHFRAKAWFPKQPELTEPLTGLSMGDHAEIMAQSNGLDRKEQDRYALASHQKAEYAQKNLMFAEEIIPIWAPPQYEQYIDQDNAVRFGQTIEEFSNLKPIFDKRYGSVTIGNASNLTDGASVCLIADEKRAFSEGMTPKLRILDYDVVAVDPNQQLLIGPAITIPRLLIRNDLQLSDIDRFEIHEAFSAQIISCIRSMESQEFCERNFGTSMSFGSFPEDKLNVNGGSIAIGHPFGATGVRLMSTIANELKRSDLSLGIVSVCAAGAMAASILVERIS